jgi:hypothetical protein
MTCLDKHKYVKKFKQATQDLWRSYSVNELTCQNYKVEVLLEFLIGIFLRSFGVLDSYSEFRCFYIYSYKGNDKVQ